MTRIGIQKRSSLARAVVFAALAAAFSARGVAAEEVFPTRPIRLIVPFPPGPLTSWAG